MASRKDVDRWRALADAATPGPWVDEFSPEGAQVVPVDDGSGYICHPAGDEDGRLEPNMAFIAAARDAVPAMADMIARLALALRDYADLYGATIDAATVLAEYDGSDITIEARGRPWRGYSPSLPDESAPNSPPMNENHPRHE